MTKKKNPITEPAHLAGAVKEAYECLLNGLGEGHIMTFRMKYTLACEYFDGCMYEELYQLTEGITEEAFARFDELVEENDFLDLITFRLASCVETQRLDEAVSEGEKTLPVLLKKYGSEVIEIASYSIQLGDAYMRKGMYAEAEKLLKKTVSRMEKMDVFASEPAYYTAMINRAGCLNAMGRITMARHVLSDLRFQIDGEKYDNEDFILEDLADRNSEVPSAFVDFLSAGIAGVITDFAYERIGDGKPFTFRSILKDVQNSSELESRLYSLASELEEIVNQDCDDDDFLPYPDEEE